MIPQTDRRCKPFLAKKRPGREKAHGVSSRPGVRTARPVQTPSGKLSAVVWAAGAGFMQGAVLWGAPQGRRRRRRAGAARRSPRSGPPAGRGCGGFMVGPDGAGRVPGGRPGRRPGTGAAAGRPHAAAGGGPQGGWCGGNAWVRAGRAEAGRSPAAGAAGAGLRGPPRLCRKENGYSWSCSPTSRSRTIPPVAGRFLVRRRWSLGTMPGT